MYENKKVSYFRLIIFFGTLYELFKTLNNAIKMFMSQFVLWKKKTDDIIL